MLYRYASQIKEENIKIEKLNDCNFNLTKNFVCGNEYIDTYLSKKAKDDSLATTHLIIDKTDNTLVGFFSISASGISFNMSGTEIERENQNRFNIPAVELDFFAVNRQFQHMYYDEIAEKEKDDYFLSDILLEKIISFILSLRDFIGFKSIILYSVPKNEEAKPLDIYIRFGFKSFEEFMEPSRKRFLDGCIPLYINV